MMFRPELAELVMTGEKTVTRRLVSENPRSPWYRERCALRVGETYAIQPGRGKPAIGRAVITAVTRERLGVIDEAEARREGFAGVLEFEAAFAGLNHGYDPDDEVWRIALRPVAHDQEEAADAA
jgi:hypothetical protein